MKISDIIQFVVNNGVVPFGTKGKIINIYESNKLEVEFFDSKYNPIGSYTVSKSEIKPYF